MSRADDYLPGLTSALVMGLILTGSIALIYIIIPAVLMIAGLWG